MKKILNCVFSVSLCSYLYGQTFDIKEGWQLKGATEDIDLTSSSFNNSCIDTIWKYDSSTWQLYLNDNELVIGAFTASDSKLFINFYHGGFFYEGNDMSYLKIYNTKTDDFLDIEVDIDGCNGMIVEEGYLFSTKTKYEYIGNKETTVKIFSLE